MSHCKERFKPMQLNPNFKQAVFEPEYISLTNRTMSIDVINKHPSFLMKAYIAISRSNRQALDKELSAIKTALLKLNIDPFVFVDNYTFSVNQERKMMKQAAADIDRCNIPIAETSEKGIGIGVEVGYAKAKMKPIIYLRHKNADHSTTVSGISDFQIIYQDIPYLERQLEDILTKAIKPGEKP